MPRRVVPPLLVPALAVLLTGAVLTGCSATPGPNPTTDAVTTPSSNPAPTTPSPTPTGPELVPDGTAADNLPLFTEVMNDVWATKSKVKGKAYVDALVSAGFPKSAMQVTRDKTTVGNPADSIQFSVLWDGECLIGQVGPSIKTPTAAVMSELPGGGCLIGDTRPIDW